MPDTVEVVPYDPTWPRRFAVERARLVAALGWLAAGGHVARVEHVGSTSVPGLAAKPCVDVLVTAWPVPLPSAAVAALERLGYAYRGEHGIPGRDYFTKGPHHYHLHVVEPGSGFAADHLLFRDYLRAEPAAAARYASAKRELAARYRDARERYQEGKGPVTAELLAAADRWYREEVGFASLVRALRDVRDLPLPWWVSSGWALDLHLGRVTRLHHDVDLGLFRDDQLVARAHLAARGWRFVAPHEGRLEPVPDATRLEPPRHQLHAHRQGEFLDLLLNEREGDAWRFRRDPRVTRARERLVLRSPDGLPYLAPEVALLFKSATSGGPSRPRDEADFDAVMAAGLEPERRRWLRDALAVYRPGHPWLARLT